MIAADVIADVAETFNIGPRDILGPSRKRRMCAARWCVMARLSAKGWTPHKISKAVNRHHTTVLYAMGRLNK